MKQRQELELVEKLRVAREKKEHEDLKQAEERKLE
jgi:hypothetical protein